MSLVINKNTEVRTDIQIESVRRAICNLKRDIDRVFLESQEEGTQICLVQVPQETECYCLKVSENKLEIQAGDELGFIYGIYEVSRSILGISNFWFWNDQKVTPQREIKLSDTYQFDSKPFQVRFRGWFINDEVLLHTWCVDRKKETPWEMVFEALLRCGGNMVIPGTDKNSICYRKLASDMGLFITHHHAEPLGAEMFSRAFPNLRASYAEHADKFQQLWRESIEKQKDWNIIWNLGFRGQGDCPFWENDPQYATQQSRGELMSQLIKVQYDMVKQFIPNAVCCTNLYGETMELYREGYLKLPDDVIKIWADNGYGKMVTRRQNNHNPRIYALPKEEDTGKHGVYYHVSFYDLQAANHITMLPNTPEFVQRELKEALEHGVKDFWIINCSNVKPHIYFLDLISNMWRNGNVDVDQHRINYVIEYYGKENVTEVANCIKAYHTYSVAYGAREDEHAGEQFANHVARILISQYLKDNKMAADELRWATDGINLKEQVLWYESVCEGARKGYLEYETMCQKVATSMDKQAKRLFQDSILLQAQIHFYCFNGAYHVSESLRYALEQNYQRAFYEAGKAREAYLLGDRAMRECEHGKWHGFYENECLSDVKQTAWVIEGLMSYLRNLGEGPHFYEWQREFLYSEEDRRVMLILIMENHLKDDELFKLMKARWEI